MSNQRQFDVFLAHNSQDKPQVRAIANELKRRGIKPWLDEERIRPGSSFQQEIQQAIPLVKTAAIFIGVQGLGPWQVLELESLVQECVTNNIHIIPVLLPGVSAIPENLRFLRRYRFVSFPWQVNDVEALNLLEWGITGRSYTDITGRSYTELREPIPKQKISSQGRKSNSRAERNGFVIAGVFFVGLGFLSAFSIGRLTGLSLIFLLLGLFLLACGGFIFRR